MTLDDLITPCLLVDESKLTRNIQRLHTRLRNFGVHLNPHLKTVKSVDIAAQMMLDTDGSCTVSTLQEATQFSAAGYRKMLYAVGIAPQKLAKVVGLRERGIDLTVVLDNEAQAQAVASASRSSGLHIPALIEVDTDGHRCGVRAGDADQLKKIARILCSGGAELRGVMTHAGSIYKCRGAAELALCAEDERRKACEATEYLRDAGFNCATVSMGSTPAALFAPNFVGITEVRAGVFPFCDLVLHGLGVCAIEDIAISVLATVVGHQLDRGWIILDAGWTALSRDRGTAGQTVDQGYGMVCNLEGHPYEDLIVAETNQEHGIARLRADSSAALPSIRVGTQVRILPNHACATSAQHDRYHVVDRTSPVVKATWPRFGGW